MPDLAVVVEDDAGMRNLYYQVLHNIGYEVVMAGNGIEAIDQLENCTPNIVFLDIRLPFVDGKVVLDYIIDTPHLSESHVVVVSSSNYIAELPQDITRVEFIQKPIMPNQIRRIAEEKKVRCR